MIDYRVLTTMDECRQLAALEMIVWDAPPREAIVAATVKVLVHTGGLALGAYDGTRMVGFSISALGLQDSTPYLWSHITGTHPEYQRQGIGISLKRVQRDWALAQGYHTIRWSFDPLRQQNAHFNFNMIGTYASLSTNLYHRNMYGEMTDTINAGIPTDRFEAVWVLDEAPNTYAAPIICDAPRLIEEDKNTLAPMLHTDSIQWDLPLYRVAIPSNLDALRPHGTDTIRAWRRAHRNIFAPAFEQGYAVTGFNRTESSYDYLLTRHTNRTDE